jgi:virginiamycin B lyase
MERSTVTALGLVGIALIAICFGPSRASALSITQRLLPAYPCESKRCAPSPVIALMPQGAGRLLASGVEGGVHAADVYTEVALGQSVTMTPGPRGYPATAIVHGLDGNPWLLDWSPDLHSAVLDVTSRGLMTRYEFPGREEAEPTALATGLGATWAVRAGQIERIGPGGEVTPVALAGSSHAARSLVSGPDESIWFTAGGGVIGQITSTGQLLEHASEPGLDPLRSAHELQGIAVGPDGAIWYTDGAHERIGRITTGGAVQEFQIPNHRTPYGSANNPYPLDIVAGPEAGYMYFTDAGDNAIGRVSMSGEVTEYPIPTVVPVGASEIAVLGNELVFSESNVAALGTINPVGSPNEAPLATPPAISTIEAFVHGQLASAARTAAETFRARTPRPFTLAVAPPEAGTFTCAWDAEVPRPPHGRHKRSLKPSPPVLVASGEAAFDLAEQRPLTVRLTTAGERLLAQARRQRRSLVLTDHATFSGYWAGALEAGYRQVLRLR